jgi:hypothetical protein
MRLVDSSPVNRLSFGIIQIAPNHFPHTLVDKSDDWLWIGKSSAYGAALCKAAYESKHFPACVSQGFSASVL